MQMSPVSSRRSAYRSTSDVMEIPPGMGGAWNIHKSVDECMPMRTRSCISKQGFDLVVAVLLLLSWLYIHNTPPPFCLLTRFAIPIITRSWLHAPFDSTIGFLNRC